MPGAFAEPFHNPFPAARGVLVRFAGEAVAGKFVFERVEAPDSRAEVSAREARDQIDEKRYAAEMERELAERDHSLVTAQDAPRVLCYGVGFSGKHVALAK